MLRKNGGGSPRASHKGSYVTAPSPDWGFRFYGLSRAVLELLIRQPGVSRAHVADPVKKAIL